MSKEFFHTLLVTGINPEDDKAPIVLAHARAKELFEEDLVSPLTEVGHNFGQSFSVSLGREAQENHHKAMREMVAWLASSELDFVETAWTPDQSPEVLSSHDQPSQARSTQMRPYTVVGHSGAMNEAMEFIHVAQAKSPEDAKRQVIDCVGDLDAVVFAGHLPCLTSDGPVHLLVDGKLSKPNKLSPS